MSPPGVTLTSSGPCRPHTPWYDGWMSNAFASIVQARPCPIFGRPVHLWALAFDCGPVLLLMPFGFHLTVDTLPFGGVILTSDQRGITPAFGYGAPHLSARGT